jgi:hypothetical protein
MKVRVGSGSRPNNPNAGSSIMGKPGNVRLGSDSTGTRRRSAFVVSHVSSANGGRDMGRSSLLLFRLGPPAYTVIAVSNSV